MGGGRPSGAALGGDLDLRILALPSVEPDRYHHFGLRGPRNDLGTVARFVERGVEREHVYTYREIRRARKEEGHDEWAEGLARRVCRRQGAVGGISIMATPHEARSLHQALIYALLYTLAGAISGER